MPTGKTSPVNVVDLKKRKTKPRATRDLVAIDQHSGAGWFFAKLVHDIESDLAGRRNLSRIESELIRAFAGAATTLQYLNHQVLLGESSEIDLTGYATIASTMVRIGSRLGLGRRARDVTPSLSEHLASLRDQNKASDVGVDEGTKL
jgi:hypothetical protein